MKFLSRELASLLKENGFPQDGWFYWVLPPGGEWHIISSRKFMEAQELEKKACLLMPIFLDYCLCPIYEQIEDDLPMHLLSTQKTEVATGRFCYTTQDGQNTGMWVIADSPVDSIAAFWLLRKTGSVLPTGEMMQEIESRNRSADGRAGRRRIEEGTILMATGKKPPEDYVRVPGDTYPVRSAIKKLGGYFWLGQWYVPQNKQAEAELIVNNPHLHGDEESKNERSGIKV